MIALLKANWPIVAVAAVLILLALWLLTRGRSKTRIRHQAPDALSEGAAPATRNQALIDAPSAVTAARLADSGPDIMAGIGEVIAAGAASEVDAARSSSAPVNPPVATPPLPEPVVPSAEPKVMPAPKAKTKPAPKTKAEPKPKATKSAAKKVAKPKAVPVVKAKTAPMTKPAAAQKPAPEPVTASPVEAASSAPAPAPATVVIAPPLVPSDGPAELARIKGLGPKLQTLLPTLGVSTLAQIAEWDEAEIDRIDAQLGVFQGRIRKDSWVEQARFLAGGDVAGYEAKFGRL